MNNIFRLTGKDIELTAKKKKRLCTLSAAAAVLAVVCAVTAAAGGYETRIEDTPDLSSYTYEAAPEAESSTESTTDGEYNVTVTADGKTLRVSASGTTADALSAAGIELGKHDAVTPDLSETLEEGTEIIVQRVVFYRKTKVKKLSYSTKYRDDENLPEGTEEIITRGEKGEMVIKSISKVVDGEEVAAKTVSEELVSEPVDEVIARGVRKPETYEETEKYEEPSEDTYSEEQQESYEEEYDEDYEEYPEEDDVSDDGSDSYSEEEADSEDDYEDDSAEESSDGEVSVADNDAYTYSSAVQCISQLTPDIDIALDENGIPVSYKESLHGKSCAYTAGEGALMSTGLCVDQGYVAVNPKIIPYGSKLYIVADDGEVYGYAVAADTGGSVGRNDILVDLFMWSYDECIQWGAKNVTIYVIE